MAAEHIASHLAQLALAPASDVRRYWLHQANLSMNQLIARKLLERDATADEAPVILDEYANTASAGSIIAFHLHRADLAAGDVGVLWPGVLWPGPLWPGSFRIGAGNDVIERHRPRQNPVAPVHWAMRPGCLPWPAGRRRR